MQQIDPDACRAVPGRKLPTTLLLILPLPVFRLGDRLMIDAQAHNGLHRWLDNFDRLILCVPVLNGGEATSEFKDLREKDFGNRLEIICLPNCRDILGFSRALLATISVIDQLIDRSSHLSFAIGGLIGDWAAVAAFRASKKRRLFSVWTDRVESEVTRFHAQRSRGLRRAYWTATAFAMKHYERLIIRRAAVGLFHGADCYSAYAKFSQDPHLVHDIHLSANDRIEAEQLQGKVARKGVVPVIVYAGRAHADKGVSDWIETLSRLKRRGIGFEATWYGAGPQLEAARDAVNAGGLGSCISFPGALQDRDLLMHRIREADIFLFCHKTPESPRCLIEALISGTPIVGYVSDYPRDLIFRHGGGLLVPARPDALASHVETLFSDRRRLSALAYAAAADGRQFTDVSVFQHRSDLIKSRTDC